MKHIQLYVDNPHNWTILDLLGEIERLTLGIYETTSKFPGSALEQGMILTHIASVLTLKLHEELARARLEG